LYRASQLSAQLRKALLFAMTCNRARALGLLAINASIRADNAGGLAFYQKQGFIDHDIIKGVPLKSGMRVDRIVKRYSLR
jgi:L-amino acid N-acyltransferase YncA